MAHLYTATWVAQTFLEQIFHLHGIPESFVTDRDAIFEHLLVETVLLEWDEIEVLLCLSSIDRRADLGGELHHRDVSTVLGGGSSATMGSTRVVAIDQALIDRDLLLQNIIKRLRSAQAQMKDVCDRGHREVSFEVGVYVWLRLQPYRQQSLAGPPRHKLSPRFLGPFPSLRCIGPVAYQLKLPDTARIHDVFHVSLLKPHSRAQPTSTPFLPPIDNDEVILNPVVVLRARLTNDDWEILVQWTDTDPDAAT
ncbi:uncharacterized protein [Aristolochia californica]|uniref:uncharacterized protein n=1 Tax=Aristolochia californica TaxID=171875 RepID=UPI0035E21A0E